MATQLPVLSHEILEQIEEDQVKIHASAWAELRPMLRVVLPDFVTMASMPPSMRDIPPLQKRPMKLLNIVRRHAVRLFVCEEKHYPDSPQLPSWRLALGLKVEKMVMQYVADVQTPIERLSFHASEDQMIATIRDALKEQIDKPKSAHASAAIGTESAVRLLGGTQALSAPVAQSSLRDRMEARAAVVGIKEFCHVAKISPASYHKIRHGEGGKTVLAKVASFLASQDSPENYKKV